MTAPKTEPIDARHMGHPPVPGENYRALPPEEWPMSPPREPWRPDQGGPVPPVPPGRPGGSERPWWQRWWVWVVGMFVFLVIMGTIDTALQPEYPPSAVVDSGGSTSCAPTSGG